MEFYELAKERILTEAKHNNWDHPRRRLQKERKQMRERERERESGNLSVDQIDDVARVFRI